MPKKIILFLSVFHEGNEEKCYLCPDGSKVTGAQTNEAPVLYLLNTYEDIAQILCVVTQDAHRNAWKRFERTVKQTAPDVELCSIPYEESQDFSQMVLPEIKRHMHGGDELLLETTGGPRNAVMYLLLVSRVLSYTGVHTAAAVYSNTFACRVEDVTHLVNLFDLVNGMQEMARFGNVDTLKKYYSSRQNIAPEINALLEVMEKLTADISLCRTSLQENIDRFNGAMKEVEHTADPLLPVLLPAFRAKFGEELDIPGVVKWCVENGMIQQALTIYIEMIPVYLLREPGGILAVNRKPGKKTSSPLVAEETELFREGIQKMGEWVDENNAKRCSYVNALKYFQKRLDRAFTLNEDYADCIDAVRQIMADYLYLRILRNMVNHANEKNTRKDNLMQYLSKKYGYIDADRVGLTDVKKALEDALERLNLQRPQA